MIPPEFSDRTQQRLIDYFEDCICDHSQIQKQSSYPYHWITCQNCGLSSQKKRTQDKARKNWNEIINRLGYTLTHIAETLYLDVRKIYRDISNEEEKMKYFKRLRVYVAGAYSADNLMDVFHNMKRGMRTGSQLLQLGFAPFVPWLDHHLVFMMQNDEKLSVEDFYEYSLSWLRVSEVMLVLPGYEKSQGTLKEIKVAEELNISIFYSLDQMVRNMIDELALNDEEYSIHIKERLDQMSELDW